ncbi:DeoR family transcriptional regulator [Camelliibacillus cellulosilyticus]|uniref:DeoR family transcriptional regulator n=1 Tax=Camelliibacillus cellulosilyticus TaxID=2174486 RepID=A0ABV9GK10_9BACL
MLPTERQAYIKKWIREAGHLKIAEISHTLGVSEMTVHRDIKILVNEGAVVKTFGGITLAPNNQAREDNRYCVICGRQANERFSYRLIMEGGTIETACCAHCGLMRHRQVQDRVQQAICYDFLLNTTISAFQATYIFESTLKISCCWPQVLTFESPELAESFKKGFGGHLYTFNEALAKLNHRDCQKTKVEEE